jgi:hypothetical protein
MRVTPRYFGLWLGATALLLLLQWPNIVASQVSTTAHPNRVKAAFLRNFTHYVTWPAGAFPDSDSPWCIGILGPDPFGELLESTLAGRTEQGRPFEVFRADSLDKLPKCQLVFISFDNPRARRAVLRELKDQPVLTVSDAPEFLREGGIIRFQVSDRVGMSINLDQARAVSLNIQTRMLEVSNEVLENGVVRKVR